MSNTEAALANLRANAEAIRKAETETAQLVATARNAGASWQQVGDALGMSRQSAHERFKREQS